MSTGLFEKTDPFEKIAVDLHTQGYCIIHDAIPQNLLSELKSFARNMHESEYARAGIGRKGALVQKADVRRDKISWISDESEEGKRWLTWADDLRQYLNQRLFMGLFSFESHFSHYGVGDFYKRHVDSFQGQTNRILSLVTYLNQNWLPEHQGELVLYKNENDLVGTKVPPGMGTTVLFLSEEFPHEVLPASRDRYSIAGWYRINNSSSRKVDPSR